MSGLAAESLIHGSRVLIVEDDVILCRGYARTLKPFGAVVECVQTIKQASLKIGEWGRSPYEAVVLDLALPDGDGRELIPRFARLHTSPAILVASAHLEDERAGGLWRHVPVLLHKPVGADDVVWGLETLAIYRRLRKPADALASRCRLSPRERGVLLAELIGLDDDRASEWMMIKPSTLQTYRNRLFAKLNVRSQRAMLTLALHELAADSVEPKLSPSDGTKTSGYFVLGRREIVLANRVATGSGGQSDTD